MALDLTDKHILVVGAGGGIGAPTAKAFANAGARVFATGTTVTIDGGGTIAG